MKFFTVLSISKQVMILILITLLTSTCSLETKYKIGFMLPSLTLERSAKDRIFFEAMVKKLGGEVISVEANNDDQLQISQAKELISKGVKVLVVMPVNKNTAAAIVRYAHGKNVTVIAYERIISNCDLDYFLTFDNVQVGELMAAYAIKHKPKGTYVLFGGDKTDQNAIWVKQGQHNIIDPFVKSGEISIAYDIYIEDWSEENAKHETKNLLKLSGNIPDVFLSSNDGMASGIIEALENENVNKFPIVTGQDAELKACRNIVKGKQSVTIYKPIKLEAETAAALAMKCARDEKDIKYDKKIYNGKIEVASILISPKSVDINNLESTVIADGFLNRTNVYENK